MSGSYWDRSTDGRLSRRTVLIGAAGLAGSAAALAACGGGGGREDVSSRVKIFDEKKPEAPVKRGGTWPGTISSDPASLDPFKQTSFTVQTLVGGYVYSRLMKYATGPEVDPSLYESAPDLAEKYEVSSDGLTYTFRLRQNAKFHNVPPLNGRLLDAEDVTFSYKRFSTLPAPQYSNSFKALVDGVTAPDKRTAVFKLSKPNANFISLITQPQYLWIMPREIDGGLDPLQKAIGTGPWMLTDYSPSARIEYRRHPDYHEPGMPYLDRVELFLIPETSQQLAQFQAGRIYTLGPRASDFPQLLKDIPDVRVLKGDIPTNMAGIGIGRGDPNSPALKDERVRRAISMSLDRDLIIESLNDAAVWQEIGLEREYRLNNFVPAGFSRWWVDPRASEMGEAAKWFKYDVAEAKKLLTAAGFPNGFDIDFHYSAGTVYGTTYPNAAQVIAEMLGIVGIKPKQSADDYATVHNTRGWAGELPGIVFGLSAQFGDPDQYLDYHFGPTSTRNQMRVNDALFNDLYEKQQQELDPKKRRDILVQIYKHLGNAMRFVPVDWRSIAGYSLAYPFVKNIRAYRSSSGSYGAASEGFLYRWLDK